MQVIGALLHAPPAHPCAQVVSVSVQFTARVVSFVVELQKVEAVQVFVTLRVKVCVAVAVPDVAVVDIVTDPSFTPVSSMVVSSAPSPETVAMSVSDDVAA